MHPVFLSLVVILLLAQVVLPRSLAFLPLIVAACHLGNVEIVPQFTTLRLLIALGILRAAFGGFLPKFSTKGGLDPLFLIFAVIALASSIGHKPDEWFPSPLGARAGLVLNVLGTYIYGRTYLPDIAHFKRYASYLLLVLIPLALGMLYEQKTRLSAYYMLGASREEMVMREDRVRAVGPFRHPILAGDAGATALPFAFLLWQMGRRRLAIVGCITGLTIVLACSSSGPLAAVAVTMASIFFWNRRPLLRLFLWGGVAMASLYSLIKLQGPWYLMASIDLVGGSTGWHRAKLIDQGFKFLDEWWLWGTDYTRHWMSSGVRWNPNMVDLTNYYLHLGVTGGAFLSLALIAIIYACFRMLKAKIIALKSVNATTEEVVLWCAAASLLTHAVSFISISYFDQMYVFFYLLVGATHGLVGSVPGLSPSSLPVNQPSAPEPVVEKPLRFYS